MLKTLTREDAVITGFQETQNKCVTKAGGGGHIQIRTWLDLAYTWLDADLKNLLSTSFT